MAEKLVFIVLKNDSLDCVFSDVGLAEAYVERQKRYQKELFPRGGPLFYYRYYPAVLDEAGEYDYRRGPKGYPEEPPVDKRGRRADGLDEER
jgi:hypothetical protein